MTWDLGQGRQLAVPQRAGPASQGRRAARLAGPLVAVGRAPPARRGPTAGGAHRGPPARAGRRPRRRGRCSTATPVVTVLLDRRAAGDLASVTGALATALCPIDPRSPRRRSPKARRRPRTGRATRSPCCASPTTSASRTPSTTCPGCGSPARRGSSRRTPGSRARCCPPSAARPRRSWTARRAGRCSPSTAPAARSRRSPRRPRCRAPPSRPGWTCAIQTAAEDAVEPVTQPAVLVAVAPSTGDLLAVAQNGPADAAGAISLTGRYPPGSTFKMVTATAAVAGLHLTRRHPGAVPGRHRDRRSAGAQRGRVRPRHRAAAHGLRAVLQHDVRAAGRAAAARRAAQRRAARWGWARTTACPA